MNTFKNIIGLFCLSFLLMGCSYFKTDQDNRDPGVKIAERILLNADRPRPSLRSVPANLSAVTEQSSDGRVLIYDIGDIEGVHQRTIITPRPDPFARNLTSPVEYSQQNYIEAAPVLSRPQSPTTSSAQLQQEPVLPQPVYDNPQDFYPAKQALEDELAYVLGETPKPQDLEMVQQPRPLEAVLDRIVPSEYPSPIPESKPGYHSQTQDISPIEAIPPAQARSPMFASDSNVQIFGLDDWVRPIAPQPSPAQRDTQNMNQSAILPRTPSDPRQTQRLVLYFDDASTTLSPLGKQALKNLAAQFDAASRRGITIEGHASPDANPTEKSRVANVKISMDRAYNASQTLVGFGIPPQAIQVQAWGDLYPPPPEEWNGKTLKDAARRVEIFY